jgi:hypothetical protein
MSAQLKVNPEQLAAVMIYIVCAFKFGLESKPSFLSEKHTQCSRQENASNGIVVIVGLLAICPDRAFIN